MTIDVAVEAAQQASNTTFGRWLLGGGVAFFVSVVFWVGLNLGRINQTLIDLAERVERIEGDGRNARAASFGLPPRGQNRRRGDRG